MVVRVRRMMPDEVAAYDCAVDVDVDTNEVVVSGTGAGRHADERRFTFDRVYGQQASQTDLFDATASPVVGEL